MQAVNGKYFQSSRSKQKNLPSFVDDKQRRYTEQSVLLTSNCWGFAWEVLYQSDNPDTSAMTVSSFKLIQQALGEHLHRQALT